VEDQEPEKRTLSSIILKHNSEFGLRKSIKLIKEMQKRNNSQSPLRWQRFLEETNEPKNPEEEFKKIQTMVKEVNFTSLGAL